MEADVTGLMARSLAGWEERAAKLCHPENFVIDVRCTQALWERLTPNERERLPRKLSLVAQAAALMAAGMLKGTIKYATDQYDLRQWVAHLLGEGADQMNYQLLLADAFDHRHVADPPPSR